MATIQEIMMLSPSQRYSQYKAVNINEVIIDGNKFTNYGAYSFLWEKAYVKSPERASNGSMSNLDSQATFITGHLKIDFSLISIDDYRRLMQLVYAKNEFTVECYDIVWDKTIKIKMYFATEEMPKLWTIAEKMQKDINEWENWITLVGMQSYTVEMIGTNNDLDTINVSYHYNPPSSTGESEQTANETDVYKGEEIIIGSIINWQNNTFNNTYKFKNWNTKADGSGFTYIDGNAYTINNDTELYAIWEQ